MTTVLDKKSLKNEIRELIHKNHQIFSTIFKELIKGNTYKDFEDALQYNFKRFESTFRAFKISFKKNIFRINAATISQHGGNFVPPSNFLHEKILII